MLGSLFMWTLPMLPAAAWAGVPAQEAGIQDDLPAPGEAPVASPMRSGPGWQGVVGGDPAPPEAWPDAVAVYNGSVFGCSGVLISPTDVLTAGHCGWNVTEVVVGTHDYTTGGQRIEVTDIAVHEDYFSTYDVALLRLAEPATVPPRALAVDCIAEDYVVDGADVAVVGFGAIDEWADTWTTELHEAWTTVRDHDCDDTASGCNEAVMPGGELIAGGDGVDSCNGDSGGPLYLATPEGDWLLGVTSRAASPAERPCGDGGIYVRVDAVADWLEDHIESPLVRPDCDGMNRAPRVDSASLRVPPGGTATTQLLVDDPNDLDQHTFAIVEDPRRGRAMLSPVGDLVYTAPLDSTGTDRIVVRVSDDGEPPLSVDVELPVEVAWEPSVHRGCATVSGGAGSVSLVVAGLLALARRRRGGPR